MLKLNLQYFGHLMGTADSLDKTPTLGKTGGGGFQILGCVFAPEFCVALWKLLHCGISWHICHMEEEMATHSSILAWKIPWTETPGGLQSMGSKASDTTERMSRHRSLLMQENNDSKNQKV